MQQIERTLRRLGTDHLDIYYAHHPDPSTPMDHTIRAFDDLIHQGKVLWVLSTYPAWQLTEAVLLARQYGWYSPCLPPDRLQLDHAPGRARDIADGEVWPQPHRVQSTGRRPVDGPQGHAACHRRRAAVDGWQRPWVWPEHIAVAEQIAGLGQKWDHTRQPRPGLAAVPSDHRQRHHRPGDDSRAGGERGRRGRAARCRADGRLGEKSMPAPAFSGFRATRWRISRQRLASRLQGRLSIETMQRLTKTR